MTGWWRMVRACTPSAFSRARGEVSPRCATYLSQVPDDQQYPLLAHAPTFGRVAQSAAEVRVVSCARASGATVVACLFVCVRVCLCAPVYRAYLCVPHVSFLIVDFRVCKCVCFVLSQQ